MKKSLFIFDGDADPLAPGWVLDRRGGRCDIFPLASDWSLINRMEKASAQRGENNSGARLLESARLVNEEVDRLADNVASWSTKLGDRRVRGRPLREWFIIGRRGVGVDTKPEGKGEDRFKDAGGGKHGEVSTWWFSMISERNTLKTDAFFRTAQINAIDRLLGSGEYLSCRSVISNRAMRRAVTGVCRRHGVGFKSVAPMRRSVREGVKARFLRVLARAGFAGDTLHSVGLLLRYSLRGVSARRAMKGVERGAQGEKGLFLVSYFPLVDGAAAKKGVFRNGYFPALQERLKETGQPVSWLLMYVSVGNYSFKDAIGLGRTFAARGERIFFIEEFITFGLTVRILLMWVAQVIRYMALGGAPRDENLAEGLGAIEAALFIKPLWRQSFVGKRGMEGILYFEVFKRVFRFFEGSETCVYSAEMQAWEKALCAAKKAVASGVRTVGYQHASIPRNFFHYFHGPGEMPKDGGPSELPLPDVLACNGDIPLGLMEKQGYPNLLKVEALRQLYLGRCVGGRAVAEDDREPVLLVAGSIDAIETKALVGFAAALSGGEKRPFGVWLKGHPALSMDRVCAGLGIDPEQHGFEVKDGPVDRLLEVSTAVMVGASTVALEALAFGKEVIVPVFSDQMFMSPLAGFESLYHMVYSPEDLVRAVERIFMAKERRNLNPDGFISRYWNLDDSLRGWGDVLGF